MASNIYIRTNKEETRMSDIKVIKADATLNGRNKKKNARLRVAAQSHSGLP